MNNQILTISPFQQILNQFTDDQKDVFRSADPNGEGNADRLLAVTNGNNIYVPKLKSWFYYDNNRWKIDEDEQRISACYTTAMQTTRLIAEQENNTPLKTFANRCLNSKPKASDFEWARKREGFYIKVEELDKDPWKLGTPSGVIDLKTGKPCPSSREEFITKSISVDYDSNARCALWEEYFIPSICCGDKDLENFLQLIAGLLLTGSSKEELLFFFYGGGRNGKGTFTGTLAALLNDYYYSLPSKFLEQNKYGNNDVWAVELKGIRFALTSETGGSRVWDMERINDLTGGDTMQGCGKYQSPINWEPTHKIIVSGNNKPKVNSEGEGFWNRMALTPFLADFTNPKDQKKDLKEELKKPENLQGILNWSIKGCLNWQNSKHGLLKPQCVIDATKEFRSDSDLLKEFYETKIHFERDAAIEKKDTFKEYMEYCDEMMVPFNRRYSNQGFYKKVLARNNVTEVKIKGVRYFKGMRAR